MHPAESSSSSYGLPFCLPLLSTPSSGFCRTRLPPFNDAVRVDCGSGTQTRRDLHPLTSRPPGRTSPGQRPGYSVNEGQALKGRHHLRPVAIPATLEGPIG